jgi:hypothetical protein
MAQNLGNPQYLGNNQGIAAGGGQASIVRVPLPGGVQSKPAGPPMLGQPGQSGFQNMMVQQGNRVTMMGTNQMQGVQMHQIHQV